MTLIVNLRESYTHLGGRLLDMLVEAYLNYFGGEEQKSTILGITILWLGLWLYKWRKGS